MQITITDQEHATIMAALRFYQRMGQGDPANRDDAIHQLATNCEFETSLDDAGIDALCQKLNGSEETPLYERLGLDYWDSYEKYPRSDWQYEVECEDTNLSYWTWVECQLELHDGEEEDA